MLGRIGAICCSSLLRRPEAGATNIAAHLLEHHDEELVARRARAPGADAPHVGDAERKRWRASSRAPVSQGRGGQQLHVPARQVSFTVSVYEPLSSYTFVAVRPSTTITYQASAGAVYDFE